ncbi:MAG TPA: DUF6311 domain-containing protein [Rhizomicrobium sp.]
MAARHGQPPEENHLLAETAQGLPDVPASARTASAWGRWQFSAFAAFAGSIDALLLLGWGRIDPTNLAWLKRDPAVYQAGWEFLRRQPWTFPPTWLAHLDYPFGISAAYLDVIPIVAIPLHLVAKILPDNFQYLGLYAALCLILQAYFALKLLSRFVSDRLLVCLGTMFFLNAPILLNRLFGHFSLCSQWLIVAALYFYFEPIKRRRTARYLAPFALLTAIAGGITPYIAVMVFLIGLAAALRAYLERSAYAAAPDSRTDSTAGIWHSRLWSNPLLWSGLMAVSMGFAFLVFGFLIPGSGPAMDAPGYGLFSMNLIAPFDPMIRALYFRPISVLPDQAFEGYNYLGLGIILLGLICLARRPALVAKFWAPALRPLLYISVLLTFLALSIRIAFGTTVLLTLPVPQPVFHLLAIFRSSGRFFWPVYYLLVLGAIVGAISTIVPRWVRYGVLAAACLLQYLDTTPLMEAVAGESSVTVADPLSATDWVSAGRTAAHLIVLPAWQCDSAGTPGGTDAWPWFARFAARHGLTLNSVHDARTSVATEKFNCSLLPDRVSRGILDRNAAYVLDDRLALLAVQHERADYCRRVDAFNLCTFDPSRAAKSRELDEVILPRYRLGTEFRSDRPAPHSMLLTGLDMRPFPAVWTVGHKAAVFVRPVLPHTGDLRLKFVFGGHGAFLTPLHQIQRAIITVNGQSAGTLMFRFHGKNRERSLVIPRKLVQAGQLVEIGLFLPDAVAPSQLGLGSDGRLLGLYISCIQIVGNNEKQSSVSGLREIHY